MGKVERIVIYTLLAVMALATFSNRGLIQAKDKPEEATFRKVTIVDDEGERRIQIGKGVIGKDTYGVSVYDAKGMLGADLFSAGLWLFVYDDDRRVSRLTAQLTAFKGRSFLTLDGENGYISATLDVDKDGPGLTLRDEEGKIRASLGALKGGPGLALLDENGKPRAVLALNKDGPGLGLSGENGKGGAWLTALKSGPGLYLEDEKGGKRVEIGRIPRAIFTSDKYGLVVYDEDGKHRAAMNEAALLFLDEGGKLGAALSRASLTLLDEGGKPMGFWLHVDKDGPRLSLWDENGKTRAWLGVDKDGPGLRLYDEADKPRAALAALKGGPTLVLADEGGKLGAMLAVSEDGPGLLLGDEDGKTRAALGSISLKITETGTQIKRSPASLVLFDKEGKVIWKAPLTD